MATSEFEILRSRVQAGLFGSLPAHVGRLSWNAGHIAGMQRRRLRALLGHALGNSPFHARRLAGVDPDRFELRSVLVTSPAVSDYQVKQTPSGIAVAVQSDRPADLGALRVRLRSALTLAGLSDPDVSIRAVPALPRNPETGKLRRFIPV